MCRVPISQPAIPVSSPDSQARAKRMQVRADNAAESAAQAQVRCQEKKAQLQQLKLEMDAQLSCENHEACQSPVAVLEVSKRIDSLYLKGCSSPTERFAHQLDLTLGNHAVLDKLQKRIDSLEKGCCGHHGEDRTCRCVRCWEVRAQREQKMAKVLGDAAEVARKQSDGYRGHSVGAVTAPRAAKHLRSLQASAGLCEVSTEGATDKNRPSPVSPVLMRRAKRQSTLSASKFTSDPGCISTTQEWFPAMTPLEHRRPRSASCALEQSRRRHSSNTDF